MATLHKIVVPTDFSPPARHAAERAALIARELAAELVLLHVVDLSPLTQLRQLLANDRAGFEAELLDQLGAKLHELGEALHQRFAVAPSSAVSSGALLVEILSFSATNCAELMVLGAHGCSFMRHILLGSTAERLLRSSSLPMLVVKQAPHEAYRTVLVPVDFSPASLRSLRLAQAVAPHAVIDLVHAYTVPFEGQLRYAGVDDDKIHYYRSLASQAAHAQMTRLCEAAAVDARQIRVRILHGDASQRILEMEQELDCDLIVIGKHGENALQELLLGSTTKHVLAESQGDVLVAV